MPNLLKHIGIILFTLCSIFTFGQEDQPFKLFDFENENFILVGFPRWNSQDTNQIYSNAWYIDNSEVLNQLKENWKLTKFEYPRDYAPPIITFEIHLLKEGKTVKYFCVVTNQNIMSDSTESFFANLQEVLDPILAEVKIAKIKEKRFLNLKMARKYYNRIQNSPKLIYSPEPDWMTFEGKLTFNYYVQKDNHYWNWELKEKIIGDITDAYPLEEFDFHSMIYLNGELHSDSVRIELKCNKSLATKFNIYDNSTLEWSPFVLYLKSYWKSNKSITKHKRH